MAFSYIFIECALFCIIQSFSCVQPAGLNGKNMKCIRNFLEGCPKLKNGNVHEFIDHVFYGDELWFLYHGKKYFLEGWMHDQRLYLCLYEMAEDGKEYIWEGDSSHYPVDAFLKANIWNGQSFWEAETDIEWVDD